MRIPEKMVCRILVVFFWAPIPDPKASKSRVSWVGRPLTHPQGPKYIAHGLYARVRKNEFWNILCMWVPGPSRIEVSSLLLACHAPNDLPQSSRPNLPRLKARNGLLVVTLRVWAGPGQAARP